MSVWAGLDMIYTLHCIHCLRFALLFYHRNLSCVVHSGLGVKLTPRASGAAGLLASKPCEEAEVVIVCGEVSRHAMGLRQQWPWKLP